MSNFDIKKIEVTTHNLHFHEDASVFSIDAYEDFIVTSGGDNVVRVWKISSKKENSVSEKIFYTIALNSNIQLTHVKDLKGHTKSVNCVCINKHGLIASAGDGGKVIIFYKNESAILRVLDNLDCYDLTWNDDTLFVSLSNGEVEVYEVIFDSVFSTKLICAKSLHNDIIQGVAYNKTHNLILTLSKDKTAKLHFFDTQFKLLEKYIDFENEKLFKTGRSFFRRTCFSGDGKRLYLCNTNNNCVLVISYPFKIEHWTHKLGPFNSEPVKILTNGSFIFVLTKRSLYILENFEQKVVIDSICFKCPTDAVIRGDRIFISSLDGFVTSVKWK